MTDRTVQMVAAVYAALANDATLTTLLGSSGRVFTEVPDNQAAPYVFIALPNNNDYGSSSGDAQEHIFQVDVFTEQPWLGLSAVQHCAKVVAQVRSVLHGIPLAMSAGTMANLRCEFTQPALRDPDGVSWHGVLRFRAVTEN